MIASACRRGQPAGPREANAPARGSEPRTRRSRMRGQHRRRSEQSHGPSPTCAPIVLRPPPRGAALAGAVVRPALHRACFGALVVRDARRAASERIIAAIEASQPRRDVRQLPQPVVRPRPDLQHPGQLQRVALGFGAGGGVGVPLGVLCGCFPRINAFFLPLTIFGRNIPVAALDPADLRAVRHRRRCRR